LVVLTLAVAIGLNATLFALLDALIHPDMAMDHAGRLYWGTLYADAQNTVASETKDSLVRDVLRGAEMGDYTGRSRRPVVLEYGDRYLSGNARRVTSNFFDVAGIHAIAGRVLGAADSATNNVVLTDSIARRLFGQSNAVGATILHDGEP